MPRNNDPASPELTEPTATEITASGAEGQSESTPNPTNEFADQPQVDIGEGPFVKFIDTANYSQKQVSAADFATAGHPGTKGAEWNALNGFLIPTDYFGEGGGDNPAVKRLLQEKDQFALVDKAE